MIVLTQGLRWAISAVAFALIATGCGGGGGGSGKIEYETGLNFSIPNPTGPPIETVELEMVLNGDALIPPPHPDCASTPPQLENLVITWENATSGSTGTGSYRVLCAGYLPSNGWEVSVPLEVGSNLITITATDPDGNTVSNNITVTRITGTDNDGDDYIAPDDCDDTNPLINPGVAEINGDGIDQDCNGFEISGEPEVVFDWTTDRCEDMDLPDLPARAFRDRDGQVQLIAGELRSIGPDLNNQMHQCAGVIASHRDPNPANFNDDEMVGATYTEDGETIYAIVHNEYHGSDHPGQCDESASYSCWYNSVTLAISSDGGASFQHPLTPPEHLVANYPEKYVIREGAYGVFAPSNIIKRLDGYYYGIIQLIPTEGDFWNCLMRSDDLSDPDSWKFWDGNGFDGHFVNPYTDTISNVEDHLCPPIDFESILDMSSSLTFNEYLDRYMLVGEGTEDDIVGFYYSVSEDLINWTPRQLLYETPPPGSEKNPSNIFRTYVSILDPNSASKNFESVGKTGYFYFTRSNDTANEGLDRDLVRIPVEFFRY
jgi:hypothetical protein